MPGIIVGIDGSGHSRKALEWAIKEAAAHHSPLTVVTVHQAAAGYFGNPASYPDDVALTEKATEAARA
ncbi:MAG: universal stress protein, partial [Streptosporangiaceae bacterium]